MPITFSETEKVVEKPVELQLPVHIKEEPMEVEEIDLDCLTSSVRIEKCVSRGFWEELGPCYYSTSTSRYAEKIHKGSITFVRF